MQPFPSRSSPQSSAHRPAKNRFRQERGSSNALRTVYAGATVDDMAKVHSVTAPMFCAFDGWRQYSSVDGPSPSSRFTARKRGSRT